MSGFERALLVLGALCGLAGVALSALAAHATGPGSLDTAARFLLAHAPVLLAMAALLAAGGLQRTLGRGAGAGLALGLLLFCGDLTMRALAGVALAPWAAPAGGVVLLGSWTLLALAALLAPRRG